jgi:hypothetical protein
MSSPTAILLLAWLFAWINLQLDTADASGILRYFVYNDTEITKIKTVIYHSNWTIDYVVILASFLIIFLLFCVYIIIFVSLYRERTACSALLSLISSLLSPFFLPILFFCITAVFVGLLRPFAYTFSVIVSWLGIVTNPAIWNYPFYENIGIYEILYNGSFCVSFIIGTVFVCLLCTLPCYSCVYYMAKDVKESYYDIEEGEMYKIAKKI